MEQVEKGDKRPVFAPTKGFRKELNRRVKAYLDENGLKERDQPVMYFKTFFLVAWVVLGYGFLVFSDAAWPWKLLVCVLQGFATAGCVFNIGHDANHGAYSDKPWINELMSLSFDCNGATSSLWRYRHNILHHTYTNIAGVDFDVSSAAPLMRMTPKDPYYFYHRWQWLYFPVLYMFITPNWLVSDFVAMFVTGKYMNLHIPKPTTLEKIRWALGKLCVIAFLLVIPLVAGVSIWALAVGIVVHYAVMGILLAVTFQLAHVVEEVDMIVPPSEDAQMSDEWAVHQLRTSQDFAKDNWLAGWYLGGLNFQAIHHLLPKITHTHYRRIQPVVEQVAREFGVKYTVEESVWKAIRSHWRTMKRLSIPPATATSTTQDAVAGT
jgi:linoleoyl-CoA desaturase